MALATSAGHSVCIAGCGNAPWAPGPLNLVLFLREQRMSRTVAMLPRPARVVAHIYEYTP
jgi:hypothetical protein